MSPQKVTITTSDRYMLAGNYWPGTTSHAVIYLHQYKHTKEDVAVFVTPLLERGYHILAIDLRGHGESQGTLEKFTDRDFMAMFNDVKAAYEYLELIDPKMSVQVIGSSIGANTALVYQEMNTLESVVALSPGLDYHGIKTQDSNLVNIAMPILYVTSQNDFAVSDTKQLFDESPITPDGLNEIKIYPGGEHGIDIIIHHPEALQDVITWLDAHAGKGLAQMKPLPK